MNTKPAEANPGGGMNQIETVSPATRLLEKRRQMYEKSFY